MAVAAATSFLFEELSKKLASVAIKQFGRLLGVRRDLDKLKSTLTAIHAVIQDAEERAVKEKAVRDWVAKLRDAAYDADDLLDEFQIEFERRKGEIQQDSVMFRKVRTFFSRSNPLAFRINMSSKLKTIAEKLAMIAEERSRYQLHTLPQMATIEEDRMTGAVIDETTVYGREDDVENIVKFLLETETDREDLSVVTIVGMGGLGKTTLAQLAYKHERVVKPESFDLKIWVCVSDRFDILSIGRAIIEYVDKRCDLSVLAAVEDRVQKILAGKKFLLVLDDVWNENQTEWEKLRKMLLGGAKGSKTIVTTRSDKVASIMGTNIGLYHLGRLPEDDCWKLFKNRAFSTGDTERYPSLEAIGREIVAKCGGSPLAAKALGSLMRFKGPEIQQWKAVRDSNTWISTDEGDRVMASLRLSYNHLSPRLKQCFAYCSIFPKDSEIYRDDLILQWIAQGFIPSDANSHVVDVGNEYFNNLVMMSFLEEDSIWYCYKMHDLVHDLTQSVAGGEYFIRYADQKKEPAPQIYRFCSLVGTLKASELKDFFQESRKTRALRLSYSSEITDCIMFTRLRRLRVLNINRNWQIKELLGSINELKHLRYLRIRNNSNMSELPNSIDGLRSLLTLSLQGCDSLVSLPESIGKLANLSTLQLSGCHSLVSLPESIGKLANLSTLQLSSCHSLVSLPESIGKLANLRTLQLSGCSELVSLPQSLSNLSYLQELDLQSCFSIAELPEGMANMASLRHLKTKRMWSLKGMPSGMGQMRSLETLELFVVGEGSNHSSIAEMEHVNVIAGEELILSHLENVKSPIDAAKVNLKEKQNLRELILDWSWSDSNHPHSLIHHEEVLAELMPHPNLKRLIIYGYPGIKLPDWLIRTMGGSESALPNLVELYLGNMPNLEEWPASVLLYPRLVRLKIDNCPKMHISSSSCILPASVEELPSPSSPPPPPPLLVRKLIISGGPPDVWNGLQYICSDTLEELTIGDEWDNSPDDMVDLPEAIRRFTSLRRLQIYYCPNLARLPEWLADLTSLEFLQILHCSPGLKERCEKDTGEDWPKIAHIPYVMVTIF